VRRLGGDVQKELEGLGKRLDDDKVAREAIAPALLLMQAEKLGVNEESLCYFAAAISGAVGGDGYVSAAMKEVGLASGERPIALLWGAALAAHGIRAEVRGAGTAFKVAASGGDAVRLARLYFLYGPPLLEGGDERVINHKLAGAVVLGAKGALSIGWEGLRQTRGGIAAADLTISEGDVNVKYNAYLRKDDILLRFESTDRGRAELAARLLKLAGVSAEMRREDGKGEWHVRATTDRLAAGREELRGVLADIVREALAKGLSGTSEPPLTGLRPAVRSLEVSSPISLGRPSRRAGWTRASGRSGPPLIGLRPAVRSLGTPSPISLGRPSRRAGWTRARRSVGSTSWRGASR